VFQNEIARSAGCSNCLKKTNFWKFETCYNWH